MLLPQDSQMPMASAAKLPMDMSTIMPPSTAPAPQGAAPPPAAGGMMGGVQGFPPPGAPPQPPWNVELQADGSSVYTVPAPSPGMKPVVIGVNPIPKLPKALQSAPQ